MSTPFRPIKDRFFSFVRVTTSCWLWLGGKDKDGYGKFNWIDGKDERAHRFSWLFFKGPIEDGLCVLHSCDTPGCVNPEHLFLGTPFDNMQDRKKKGHYKRSTHCPRGHELTDDNSYVHKRGTARYKECRICVCARNNARYAAKKRSV